MMHSLWSLLFLAGVSLGAEISSRAADSEITPSNRDEKFLSVFQIVKFNNDMCNATDGSMGVCFTESECSIKGGVSSGACASTFGVCCVFRAKTCGSTVAQKVIYIESPNYPAAAPTGMCMFSVAKCDVGICQYMINFEDVVLSAPRMGDCRNDTMIISNTDSASQRVIPTNLCGTLTGQTIYTSVNSTTSTPKFTFNIVSSNTRWKIKVTQISCADTDKIAPPGCLTYDTATSGTIMSFNNQGGAGEKLNNQKFSHCIGYKNGYCDVALTASNFQLRPTDMLNFGTMAQTGSTFGTAGSLIYNFTGPYVIPFMSGSDNPTMVAGYSISYLLLPC